MTTPATIRRSRRARIVLTVALGALATAAFGCSTASWARTKPNGPTVVLHPDQHRGPATASIASAPDIN